MKDFYICKIIDILNDIRNEEHSCNEGSLDDKTFVSIICYLVDLYKLY